MKTGKKSLQKQLINRHLRTIFFIYAIQFSVLTFAQTFSNKCELDGKLFYNDCIKYTGDCQNNKANGWGELYLNSGNILKGLFVDNKIQNNNIEYFFSESKRLIIGPNKESAFHGPCISISDNYVSLANYENGYYRGNSDLFQIPKPNFELNTVFCDPDGYGSKNKTECNLILNSNFIIYTSAREYNSAGNRKYWLTVVDLSSNKIIRTFGSYLKPLTVNDGPSFLGFNKENKPVYNCSGKIIQLDISTGIVTSLNSPPIELTSQRKYIEKIKATPYKDLVTSTLLSLDKYKILNDSSYVKIFNSKAYIESVSNFKGSPGSGSSLVIFNSNHEIMNNVDFSNYNIYDFDVDEKNDRIALLYGDKDSTFLSYYELSTLKVISNVFSKKGCYLYEEINFSKTGTYLLNKVKSGTIIYLGNKLHYGIEGDLYSLNNDENIAISNSSGTVYAYDLEKKTIIWSYKIGDDYVNTKFFKIDDKIYLISGRALSWEGYKVKENGIMLNSFIMPKPLFSLVEFVKNPEEIVSTVTKKNEVLNNEKNKPIEPSSSQVKKSNDDLLSSYLALMFLSAIFESSNKYSEGSYSSSNSGSSSTSPKWECGKCHQTSYRNEQPCSICGGCEENRNHDWQKVTRKSPKAECRRCGFITYLYPCSICGGCGETSRNHDFEEFD